jgi:hypothetical protein
VLPLRRDGGYATATDGTFKVDIVATGATV